MEYTFSTYSSAAGLVCDIIGFIMISIAIIRPKPANSEVQTLNDAFDKPVIKNVVTLDYLKSDFKAKLGFFIIIFGFILQLLGVLT